MTLHKYTATEPVWYIALDKMHVGYLDTGQSVTTGQDELEIYEDEDAWRARLDELGYEWPEDEELPYAEEV